jgi:rhodanese-related sulfurtransferase
VALILRRRGIERVRPLAGGLHGWRDRGYPMVGLEVPRAADLAAGPSGA